MADADDNRPQAEADENVAGRSDAESLSAGSAADERAERSAPDPAVVAVPDPKSPGRSIAAPIALLLALAALIWHGYDWWMARQLVVEADQGPDVQQLLAASEQRTNQALAAGDQAVEAQIAEITATQEAAMRRIENRLAGSERVQAEMESVWQNRLDGLERRFAVVEGSVSALARTRQDAGEGLKLAEAEFLLRLAGQRLELFEDPSGAVRALRLADSQLKSLSDPVFDSVRQTVEREIAALEQVELPDRSAIAGRLSGVADQIDDWPFAPGRTTTRVDHNVLLPEDEDPSWLAQAKTLLGQVITIRAPGGDMSVLTATERSLIRQNVRLELEVARLAVIRGEQSLYSDAISRAKDAVNAYFDPTDERVELALRRLDEAAGVALAVDYPRIGQGLRQLRNLSAAVELAEEDQ